jgi:[protein-PII] uridylyltransferase
MRVSNTCGGCGLHYIVLPGVGKTVSCSTTRKKLLKNSAGEHNLAIEQFMQQYYRTIMELERLSEMLLQIFKEEILLTASQRKIKSINERFNLRNNFIESINERFNLRNNFIEVANPDVFKQFPEALMELFLLISLNEHCEGVTASTIRLVREHLYLVDDN